MRWCSGKLTAPQAMQAGKLRVEGDPTRLALLFTVVEMTPNPLMFDILTPGEGGLKQRLSSRA
jgi:hypothetical protein